MILKVQQMVMFFSILLYKLVVFVGSFYVRIEQNCIDTCFTVYNQGFSFVTNDLKCISLMYLGVTDLEVLLYFENAQRGTH